MLDPHLTQEKQDLKFSEEQGFFDKSKIVRYLILSLFGIVLFLVLHFREVPVEVLELNSIAPRFVISQVNFDFPDEEATLILKTRSRSRYWQNLPDHSIRYPSQKSRVRELSPL